MNKYVLFSLILILNIFLIGCIQKTHNKASVSKTYSKKVHNKAHSHDVNVLIIENKRFNNYSRSFIKKALYDSKRVFFKEFGHNLNFTSIDYKIDTRNSHFCENYFANDESNVDDTIIMLYENESDFFNKMILSETSDAIFDYYKYYFPKYLHTKIKDKNVFTNYVVSNYLKKRELFFSFIDREKLYDDRESTTIGCFEKYIKPYTKKYNLIITNNVFFDNDAFSYEAMLHGGVISGLASDPDIFANYSYSIVSLFKYLYRDQIFMKDTRFEYFDDVDAFHEISLTIAHELGHSILNLDHTYDHPECIMGLPLAYSSKKNGSKSFYNNIGGCHNYQEWHIGIARKASYFYDNNEYQEAINYIDEKIHNDKDIPDIILSRIIFIRILSLYKINEFNNCYISAIELALKKSYYLSPYDQNILHRVTDRCYELMYE